MRHSQYLFSAAFLVALAAPLTAQTPAAKNLIGNGSFETGFRRDDLWDGVDSSGFLAGNRGALPVLTTSGTIADTSMPVSVALADMNGDGILDICTTDALGYFRIYFNEGTPTEPKFGIGELSTLFLSRRGPDLPDNVNVRRGPRLHLADLNRSGKNDLIVGNYIGEILMIPNSGSGPRPDFRQPPDLSRSVIPTMKNSNDKWGNVFAPVVWDWNNDGKPDLLVGEGSYSANSIHLLINEGTGARPVFSENNRTVLAYGMGLEQLTPTIVDYNGDGHLDLLVTERTGKVAIYLNPGTPWKPGDTLPFDSFVPIGGVKPKTESRDPMDAAKDPGLLSLGGIATIAAGDLNGDGLFDLVFGKSNGRVAMSLNTGTKTEPKFAAPVEVKGLANTPSFTLPSGWDVDFGLERGNFYGYVTIVKDTDDPQAQPVDGKAVMKAAYLPSPNKVLPVPNQFGPGGPGFRAGTREAFGAVENLPSTFFRLSQAGRGRIETKKTYIFSMRVKGNRASNGTVLLNFTARKQLSQDKIVERSDRGAVRMQQNVVEEDLAELFTFSAGPQWSEVKKEFTIRFKDKELGDLTHATAWSSSVLFSLAPGDGTLYIDDVKITEK